MDSDISNIINNNNEIQLIDSNDKIIECKVKNINSNIITIDNTSNIYLSMEQKLMIFMY